MCQTGYLIPSRLRKANDCCQAQGGGQSCRYHLGNSRGKAAPEICPGAWQLTGNSCHRGEGLGFPPDPLDAGAQALGNMPRLECVRGAALLLPMLSMYLPEMHREMQGIRHQQSDHTFHQRRWNSLAQMVKADPQSYCPSDVRLHDGTACLLLRAIRSPGNGSTGWVTAISQISAKGSTDSKKCRDPMNTSRCAHREDTHAYPSQHHPNSPRVSALHALHS